ncbi:MAG TPA: tRNA pseudouridine(55) synthase TruB [Desulfobacteraceae bacterium]|nr:tRNA pseudouridine(55) synthase TruB [Desulfobacteraceae bacterium]|tara:strand:+ start:116 stop:1048 length:933 start_codon:yes stop_codon:yes gene_type:complete
MKDGILVVNKPEGLSSAAVVGRLKRALKVKKIGHTGTLDPFATGVLLIAVQKATRISRFFLDGSKGYRARVTLGVETDTYDCTGEVVFKADHDVLKRITPEDIRQVVSKFHGPQDQVAPAYSALKHEGQPLYKLARQGKIIQKPPRRIEIYSICASVPEKDDAGLPVFSLDVHCSGGTYIRSLAYDIGKALGCGAHLSGLCRTRSSQFAIEQATELAELEDMDREDIESRMVTMADALTDLPAVVVDEKIKNRIRHGQRLPINEAGQVTADAQVKGQAPVRILDQEGGLLALVEPDKQGRTYNYCCVFIT